MNNEKILDNYHYISIILSMAACYDDFYIARIYPINHPNSAISVFSKDQKISIILPLRELPKSKTDFKKDAYDIVEYAYFKQPELKDKQSSFKKIQNDNDLFRRLVDIINARLDTEEQLETNSPITHLPYIVEYFKMPHKILFDLTKDVEKNFIPLTREFMAFVTANNLTGEIITSDYHQTMTISDVKDSIKNSLTHFGYSTSEIEKMFLQTSEPDPQGKVNI